MHASGVPAGTGGRGDRNTFGSRKFLQQGHSEVYKISSNMLVKIWKIKIGKLLGSFLIPGFFHFFCDRIGDGELGEQEVLF